LRERRKDLPSLVEYFIVQYCREVVRPRLPIDSDAMALLQTYSWPGNVRELQNAMERAVVLAPGPSITVADLPAEIRQAPGVTAGATHMPDIDPSLSLADAVNAFKRARVQQALEEAAGNQSQAAKSLGLPPSNLSRLLRTLGLR
jgi:DNA-binding NtrC family response regulator